MYKGGDIPEEVATHPVGVVHEVSPALVEQRLNEEPRRGLQSLGRVVQQGPDVPRVLDRLDGHGGVEFLLFMGSSSSLKGPKILTLIVNILGKNNTCSNVSILK